MSSITSHRNQSLDYSFDQRIARQYDTQRAHPPAVATRIGEQIATLLPPDANVLELGVGTGRIAHPVANAGCNVFGVDLSPAMLAQVAQHPLAQSASKVFLAQATVDELPFRTSSMDAVLAVHVLHLVKAWQQVLAEATRTLRAGGVFIEGRDWIDPDSVTGKFQYELRRFVMTLMPSSRPPAAGMAVSQALADLAAPAGIISPEENQVAEEFAEAKEHAVVTEIMAAEWEASTSPAEVLAAIAARTHSESWILTDDLLEKANIHLQQWAAAIWPDLTQQQSVRRRFLLTATRGQWGKAESAPAREPAVKLA